MPRHSPMPPGTCSRRLLWAASFGSLLPFSALCQEVCPCGNPPVSCPVNCTQLIIPASHSIRARLNLVSLPVSFTAGVEMVQKFSAPVSRMIIYACRAVGLTSDRLLRGCHLTIRFSTIASVAMSSSSPTMIIFVSNLFFNPLHNHSSSTLAPDDTKSSSCRSALMSLYEYQNALPETLILHCCLHLCLPVMGGYPGPIHLICEVPAPVLISRFCFCPPHTILRICHKPFSLGSCRWTLSPWACFP